MKRERGRRRDERGIVRCSESYISASVEGVVTISGGELELESQVLADGVAVGGVEVGGCETAVEEKGRGRIRNERGRSDGRDPADPR